MTSLRKAVSLVPVQLASRVTEPFQRVARTASTLPAATSARHTAAMTSVRFPGRLIARP